MSDPRLERPRLTVTVLKQLPLASGALVKKCIRAHCLLDGRGQRTSTSQISLPCYLIEGLFHGADNADRLIARTARP